MVRRHTERLILAPTLEVTASDKAGPWRCGVDSIHGQNARAMAPAALPFTSLEIARLPNLREALLTAIGSFGVASRP